MKLYCAPAYAGRSQRWAEHLTIAPLTEDPPQEGYYLRLDGPRLRLCCGPDVRGVCLTPDEVARRADPHGALARACRASPQHRPLVVDATAGLGMDTLTLASLGCEVIAFERIPALWAMLDDYVECEAVSNVSARCEDAFRWLAASTTQQPCCDTLYLDPMFPPRRKTALPNKAMQYVRAVVAEHGLAPTAWDVQALCRCARERVVLKRRRKDPAMAAPDWQIHARTVRYDIYRGLASG